MRSLENSDANTEPFRLSITGIDGSGKDTIARLALERAAENLDVIKLGRPAYEFVNGESVQLYSCTTRGFDTLHHWADSHKSRPLITGVNALNVLAQSRILERQVLLGDHRPDIVASSRDPRIDPAVYFSYYAPNPLSRAISIERRLRMMQILTGVKRDLIIKLDVDPRVAVERIESRMHAEAETRESTQNGSASMRDKWRHMHENVNDLTNLARVYDIALMAIQEVVPTTVLRIDTSDKPPELIAATVCYGIMQTMRGTILPGEQFELHEAA